MANALDRYITERYLDSLCRDTGVTRDQAIEALRRALQLTHSDLRPAPRPHNPTAVLAVIIATGLAWTAAAAAVLAVIFGWRP